MGGGVRGSIVEGGGARVQAEPSKFSTKIFHFVVFSFLFYTTK